MRNVKLLDKKTQKNFLPAATAFLCEGFAYHAATTFFSPNTVLVLLVSAFGGKAWLSGAFAAIRTVGFALPQILIARRLGSNSTGLLPALSAVQACASLAMALVVWLRGSFSDMSWYAVLISVWAVVSLAAGAQYLPWSESLAATIPDESRTQFLSIYQVFGGIGSLVAGSVVSIVLGQNSQSYASAFGTLFMLGALAMAATWPAARVISSAALSENETYECGRDGEEDAASAWKPIQTGTFFAVIFLSAVAATVSPYVLRFLANEGAWTARAALFEIIGVVLGSAVASLASSIGGVEAVLVVDAAAAVAVPMMGLWASTSVAMGRVANHTVLAGTMIATGMFAAAYSVGVTGYILQNVPACERPSMTAKANFVTLPVSLVVVAGGFVMEHVGAVPLFSGAFVLGIAALAAAVRLSNEGSRGYSLEEDVVGQVAEESVAER